MLEILNFDSDKQLISQINNAKSSKSLNKIFHYCMKQIKKSGSNSILRLNYRPLYYISEHRIIPVENQDEYYNYNLVVDYLLNRLSLALPNLILLTLPKHRIYIPEIEENFFLEFNYFLESHPNPNYQMLEPIIDQLGHDYLTKNLIFSEAYYKNSKTFNYNFEHDDKHLNELLMRFGYGFYNQTSFTFNYPY